jgi:hypothetical protein
LRSATVALLLNRALKPLLRELLPLLMALLASAAASEAASLALSAAEDRSGLEPSTSVMVDVGQQPRAYEVKLQDASIDGLP